MSRPVPNPYKLHTFPTWRSCLYESRCRPSSYINQVTDHNTSACGVRITTDDVAGSFAVLCQPQASKLRKYCPYSESSSEYKSLHTVISEHLSNSLHLHMHLYMYLHQRYASIPITLPQASQKLFMRSAFFWENIQLIVVIPCRPLRQGPTFCRYTSIGITIIRRVISQKSADLINLAAEV